MTDYNYPTILWAENIFYFRYLKKKPVCNVVDNLGRDNLCVQNDFIRFNPTPSKCHTRLVRHIYVIFKKYKTFSVLIYSYINASGNCKNEKLCGNTTPAGRSVFTQFRVFPIFTSVDVTVYQYGKNVLYFFYNIAQRTLTEEWREIFRVDI